MGRRETHIFYAPHADDETLSMGPAIRNRVRAGHRVILVLLTDGAADETFQCLRGEMPCRVHGTTHDPAGENYRDQPFDKAAFIRARREEFLRAAALLGVPRDQVFFHDFPDGGLPMEEVRRIVQEFDGDPSLPGPRSHHTMTYQFDNHPDHLAAGKALHGLWSECVIPFPTWYVKRSMWSRIGEGDAVSDIPVRDEAEQQIVRQIYTEVYGNFQPEEGRYAIGGHSVPESFAGLREDFTIKAHHQL